MGCSSSQGAKVVTTETKENGINEQMEGDRQYPPPEAFEVSLNDESDSIIKKHPPKRLQRLVDAPSTQTTIEELEEKLANAEIRRNQFLSERVSTLKTKDDESDADTLNGNEKLAVVEESNEPPNNEEPLEMLPPTEADDLNTSNNTTQENN